MFCFEAKIFENAAALNMASYFLIRQKAALFADNLCAVNQSESQKFNNRNWQFNKYTLFGVLVDNTRGYFTSCVVLVRFIRGLLFHCILFLLRPPLAKKNKTVKLVGIVQCNTLAFFARSLAFIW